jgi:hypothetical protein
VLPEKHLALLILRNSRYWGRQRQHGQVGLRALTMLLCGCHPNAVCHARNRGKKTPAAIHCNKISLCSTYALHEPRQHITAKISGLLPKKQHRPRSQLTSGPVIGKTAMQKISHSAQGMGVLQHRIIYTGAILHIPGLEQIIIHRKTCIPI